MGKINKFSKERFMNRNIIVRKVGLDTSVFVDMILKEPEFYIHDAKIIKRGGLYVNYYIIQEAWGILVHEKKIDKKEAGSFIDRFIEKSRIKVIRKEDISEKRVNSYFELLKKQEEIYRNVEIAGNKNSDLLIISIYKTADIDCIFTRNSFDFQRACKYLGLDTEKQLSNTQLMLKRLKRRNY